MKTIENSFRMTVNIIIFLVVPYWLFTIDAEGEETAVDQVKDFTALMIIVDLDNILAFTLNT